MDVRTDVVLQTTEPVTLVAVGKVDDRRVDGAGDLDAGPARVDAGTQVRFPAGAAVPTVAGAPTTDREWLEPGSGDGDHQLLGMYSPMVAVFLGTMGLPHVLVRFYTNPDGRAARRTAVPVLAHDQRLLHRGRARRGDVPALHPELLVTGQSDAAVLLVPSAALGEGWVSWLLGGLVAAGAAAALLSTSSGLVVSLAGVLFTDVLRGKWKDFRLAAVLWRRRRSRWR